VLSLATVAFSLVTTTQTSNWYVAINHSQVELIVGPYNASYITTLLSGASKAVYIEVYELTDKDVANTLSDLASRGVQVYVVLSGNVYGGIPSSEKKLVGQLNSSGVHVTFNKDFTYVHSKVFVIDNKTVILGSINPTYYGLHKDYGVDLVIHNSTIARVYASIILSDFYRVPVKNVNYPGVVVSPVNSYKYLSTLLSQNGTVYLAFEELYPSSGLFDELAAHQVIGAVAPYSENSEAVKQFGLKQVDHLTAKVIVVGDYVYVGSVNLSSKSIFYNRELGIIVKDPVLASELRGLIENWSGVTTTSLPTTQVTQEVGYSKYGLIIALLLLLAIIVILILLSRR
jgi:phosphatidylserine/phosphatidylglycerophosphate/cardiolipin synthase-like enzyme